MRRMTAERYSGSPPFLKVLDRGKENTRISLQARLQLFTLSYAQGVLIPELAKDLKLPIDAHDPRLVAPRSRTEAAARELMVRRSL